jgi:hypothetical protein
VDTFNKRDHGNINRHFERVLETELNKPNADSKKAHKRVRERSRKFGEKLQRIFHSAFSALMSCDENTDLSIHLNRKGVIEIIIPYTFQKHQDAFSLIVENVPTELITELEEKYPSRIVKKTRQDNDLKRSYIPTIYQNSLVEVMGAKWKKVGRYDLSIDTKMHLCLYQGVIISLKHYFDENRNNPDRVEIIVDEDGRQYPILKSNTLSAIFPSLKNQKERDRIRNQLMNLRDLSFTLIFEKNRKINGKTQIRYVPGHHSSLVMELDLENGIRIMCHPLLMMVNNQHYTEYPSNLLELEQQHKGRTGLHHHLFTAWVFNQMRNPALIRKDTLLRHLDIAPDWKNPQRVMERLQSAITYGHELGLLTEYQLLITHKGPETQNIKDATHVKFWFNKARVTHVRGKEFRDPVIPAVN